MVVTHGSLQPTRSRCALTIGNFDGVHRGHRALIERVTAKARELSVPSCVLTFEPHPREFFAGPKAPTRLTRLRDKLELLAAAGVQLGRELGFPTANIVLRHPSPLSGIYVVDAGERGPGVASVGKRPTVNPVEVPLLEVHLFGETRDLYGEHLKVRFLKKLRDERKFDGLPALRDAIARDAAQAKEYFTTHG